MLNKLEMDLQRKWVKAHLPRSILQALFTWEHGGFHDDHIHDSAWAGKVKARVLDLLADAVQDAEKSKQTKATLSQIHQILDAWKKYENILGAHLHTYAHECAESEGREADRIERDQLKVLKKAMAK